MYKSPLFQDILAKNNSLAVSLGIGRRIKVTGGDYSDVPVNVQVLEDGCLIYCSHTDTHKEKVSCSYDPAESSLEEICDVCGEVLESDYDDYYSRSDT